MSKSGVAGFTIAILFCGAVVAQAQQPILPWRAQVEKRLEKLERAAESAPRQAPQQQAPQIVERHYYYPPKQDLPIAGLPRQDLPIAGTPRQELPREGTPKQELPQQGTPKQELRPDGTPRQVLPQPGETPKGLPNLPPTSPGESKGGPTGYQRFTAAVKPIPAALSRPPIIIEESTYAPPRVWSPQ